MKYLLRTAYNTTFSEDEIEILKNKLKSSNLYIYNVYNGEGYHVFVDITTRVESETFSAECEIQSLYGGACMVDGIYYSSIVISYSVLI